MQLSIKSAQDIRALMPASLEHKIALVIERIEAEALDGQSSLYLNYAFGNNMDLWYFSEGKTDEWKKAKAILEEKGFKVEFFSTTTEYANQPSATVWNRGTLISWSNE